jgi:putative FmdB family regulatory protein
MPLYEYTCHKCSSDFELLIRGDEAAECPGCGSRDLEKLLSVPAAHTAGSSNLPVCGAAGPASCGLPDCGSGGCPLQ